MNTTPAGKAVGTRTYVLSLYKVNYKGETDGITRRSLQKLRNDIADNRTHKMVAVVVRTSDIGCGIALVDLTSRSIHWSGDGFRTDGGGEGGAGYRGAMAMLKAWGLCYFEDPSYIINPGKNIVKHPYKRVLGEYCEDVLDHVAADPYYDFVVPGDTYPQY